MTKLQHHNTTPTGVLEPRPPWRPANQSPALKFSPTAWAKLIYLRDLGDTEVGGFGISAEDNPLLIEDVQLVQQSLRR